MVLQLNEKEKETLKKVLQTYERDLRGEILKTDDSGLKAVLHEEDAVLRGLLKQVA